MPTSPLSHDDCATFNRDGYVIKRGFYTPDEMKCLISYAKGDIELMANGVDMRDVQGRVSKLALWNDPGDDLYGMFSRGERVVRGMEQVLGGEVYHYHAKMMLKEPKVGGAWEWHQDYGYWYNNGCLRHDMASCMVAVDRAMKANGCLQVLKGTHHLGRVEHGKFGTQVGADPQRVEWAMQRHELVYVEAEPGDALFFHSNLLHASSANTSEHSRWSLIMCYNTRENDPFIESGHPRYNPIAVVDDGAILRWTTHTSAARSSFMRQGDDLNHVKAG